MVLHAGERHGRLRLVDVNSVDDHCRRSAIGAVIVRETDCAALLLVNVTAFGQLHTSGAPFVVQVKDTVTDERYQPYFAFFVVLLTFALIVGSLREAEVEDAVKSVVP